VIATDGLRLPRDALKGVVDFGNKLAGLFVATID
jgi:hypothetical protein